MSNYPISGCGLSSKPRASEPSMFEILSWTGNNDLPKPTVLEAVPLCVHPVNIQKAPSQNASPPKFFQQEIYKQHKSPEKPVQTQTQKQSATIPQKVVQNNEPQIFQKSHLFKKPIKNELNSYEPIYLKASRAKSTHVSKPEHSANKDQHKQEAELDQRTIKERKQKLKEFEIFTRVLPNSAFTTYYGKPAFENYGRGTSYQNLKSFNVMPHKGDNHPKNVESHYTALIKARNIKSKSYLPRKPIEESLPVHSSQENQESVEIPSLPLEKPDLIKSNRFATVAQSTGKKAGPPQTTKRNIKSARRAANHGQKSRQQKSVSFKQPTGDGLKYMNKRDNLIDLLEQKRLKASQLAYKITECYPIESDVLKMQESAVSKENWDEQKPAGKASNKGEALKDLIESRFVLQENNSL